MGAQDAVNPVAQLRTINDGGHVYQAIVLWCPGCEHPDEQTSGGFAGGLHMLAVSGDAHGRPMWTFDGNLERPTLSPSILTRYTMAGDPFVCHSFLRDGVWEFLGDCTHQYAGQSVPMKPLPDWCVKEAQP